MYTFDFQWEMFLRAFFICFFYTSGIGMLVSLILRPCHSKFYRNYFLRTDSFLLKMVGIANLCLFVSGLVYEMEKERMKLTEHDSPFLLQAYLMIMISLILAAVQSYCHPMFMQIMKMTKLDSQSLRSTRFRNDYLWSSDLSIKIKEFEKQRKAEGASKEEIRKEKEKLMQDYQESKVRSAVQMTICRLNIDMSMYYLSFFEETPEKLLRRLLQRQNLPILEKGDLLVYNERFSEDELFRAITDFECHVFNYKYCTKSNQYDAKRAYAYTFAIDLVQKKLKTSGPFLLIGIFYAGVLVFQCMQMVLLVVENMKKMNEETIVTLIGIPFLVFVESLPYVNLMFFAFQGIKIMKSKYIYMKELEQLMTSEEGSYPMMNILDFKSLEAWIRLRKIFMHLDNERLQGIILALTLVMMIDLAVLGWNFVRAITNLKSDKELLAGFGGFLTLFYLTSFLIFAYYAARVNAQFQSHRHVIGINKRIATSLFNNYSDFVGENSIEPGTFVHKEGLKYLKEEYGENFSEGETEKKMKRDYKKLVQTYDSILDELKQEEDQHPIRILGVSITKTLVKSFGALLISISAPMVKQGLMMIFKSKKD